jgi:hypothetical protein
MSFVDHYLPYFRQQLITHPLSDLLPFRSLFTESSCGGQLLAPPSFFSVLTAPRPLCRMFFFCSLFIIQFGFLWGGQGVSLPRGLRWFILGVAGGIPHDAWYSPVGLLNVSQAGLEPVSGSVGALLFSV